MAATLLVTLCLLVVAASALPGGMLPRDSADSWAVVQVSTETPYTKPTEIPDNMPESCSARPEKNDYLMIVSPQTCTRFIVCDGFRETEMACPAGLYFNYEEQYCDWPGISGCDESKRPGVPTTEYVTATDATDARRTDVTRGPTSTTTPRPPQDEETKFTVVTASL